MIDILQQLFAMTVMQGHTLVPARNLQLDAIHTHRCCQCGEHFWIAPDSRTIHNLFCCVRRCNDGPRTNEEGEAEYELGQWVDTWKEELASSL